MTGLTPLLELVSTKEIYMGFIMDGLDAETYDRKYADSQLVARIIGYFRPQLRIRLFGAGLVVLSSLMDTAYPLLMARSLDTLAADKSLQTIAILVAVILVTGIFSWIFNFLRQRYTARSVGNVVLNLQQDAFAAIVARDMSFYDEYPSGKIVSRVTSDTEQFATVVMLTLNLLSQLLLFFLIAAVLFYINTRLALLALTITPIIICIALGFRWIARRTTRRSQRSLARVNSNVQEVISGITVAKNFRQEQNMDYTLKKVNEQSYHVNVRSGFVYNGVFPLLFLVANIGTTIVVYFGGLNVLDRSISAGEWFLFVQSIGILWLPLTSIASFLCQIQRGLSASERVFALIDAEPRVRQIDQQPVQRLAGRVEFKGVFFQYTDQQTVLAGFSLTIKAGETVALVGHTGAGKSSLGKLVARFYEFQGGQILIDGRDIRTFDLQSYHRQLGIVPQVPFLFSGTVTDNIRYARPEATDEQIAKVAQHIGWGDWLDALPDGLDTEVGEEGKALSMGQRQLVALARVLL